MLSVLALNSIHHEHLIHLLAMVWQALLTYYWLHMNIIVINTISRSHGSKNVQFLWKCLKSQSYLSLLGHNTPPPYLETKWAVLIIDILFSSTNEKVYNSFHERIQLMLILKYFVVHFEEKARCWIWGH